MGMGYTATVSAKWTTFCLPFVLLSVTCPPAKAQTKPLPPGATTKPPAAKSKTPAQPTPPQKTTVRPNPPAQPALPLSPVWSVAFSPDGKTLAVGGYKRIRFYEVATGVKLREIVVNGEAVRSLQFSADGNRLAVGTGVPGAKGLAFVLDVATGKPTQTITGHYDTVESVAFYNNTLITAAADERVVVTDLNNGQQLGKLTEHNGRCLSVAVPAKFTDDMGGEIFVTGGADNMVKVWDTKVRRGVVNFDQCQSPVWAVAVRPPHPGRFATGSGDGKIRYFVVYRDKNGKPDEQGVWPRGGNQEAVHDAHEGGVYALALASNDGFAVSGGADKKVALWGIGGGRRKTFSEAEGDIWGVAVSPDNKLVAAASLDGYARLYDVEKGKLVYTLDAKGVYTSPVVVPLDMQKMLAQLPKKLASGTGLTGSYFNDREGNGKPVLVRTDATVNFDWNTLPPADGVNRENLFVRWEGFIEAPVTGEYRFIGASDDGLRLWINNKPAIDSWSDRGETADFTDPILLKAGQRVAVKMEYYQGGGGASARLHWEYTPSPTQPGTQPSKQERQPIPTAYLYPWGRAKS